MFSSFRIWLCECLLVGLPILAPSDYRGKYVEHLVRAYFNLRQESYDALRGRMTYAEYERWGKQ